MYEFDNNILTSLDKYEVERLLYSIREYYAFYSDFMKGTPVKFDLPPHLTDKSYGEVRIHVYGLIQDNYRWTWCNSVGEYAIDKFHQAYLSVIRDRKLNELGV